MTEPTIFVGSIDAPMRQMLTPSTSNGIYSRGGYLVYVRDHSLVAQAFGPKSLKLGREAIPVAENVAFTLRWDAFFCLSDQGNLVYETGRGLEMSQLLWTDRAGKAIGTAGKPADYQGLAFSHDGRRLAVTITDPVTRHWDIWIEDLARST